MTTANNEIQLLKNNDGREWPDLDWIEEFYRFLQGDIPEKIKLGRGHIPKLSKKQAMSVIWYLQEYFPILPDHIDQCDNCKELFDSYNEGMYYVNKEKNYCDNCITLVP